MNIQIYYTLAQGGGGGGGGENPAHLKRRLSQNTLDLRKRKTERYAEKLQIHNIHYIQTRGFAGRGHRGDGGEKSPARHAVFRLKCI